MTADQLAARGYFPKELPPPFSSGLFANALRNNRPTLPKQYFPLNGSNYITRMAIHNLARAGTLRRRLALPNPLSFHELATVIELNWGVLSASTARSQLSRSSPIIGPGTGRAMPPANGFDHLPIARASARAGMKYILKTDINSFYPSVYTHSIPWALHTKPVAKTNRSTALLGNLLDKIIRNGQDGQTMGIPIGPDTSLLIAELILTDVDLKLQPAVHGRAFRYVDDYEIGFRSFADAEAALAILQSLLADFELSLNPRKTAIHDLPLSLESAWVPELRSHIIRPRTRSQATDMLTLVDKAFSFMPQFRDESVLKYTISRLSSVSVLPSNWPVYQDVLLQSALVEPGTLDLVLVELAKYSNAGRALDLVNLGDTLNAVIAMNAPLGHGSEVAWALWGCLAFGISLDQSATSKVTEMEDPVVALLALHAHSKNLLHNSASFVKWSAQMSTAGLTDSMWLLAYEAGVKGWLPSLGANNHISGHSYFDWLSNSGVSFYDVNPTWNIPAVPASTQPSAAGAAVISSVSVVV